MERRDKQRNPLRDVVVQLPRDSLPLSLLAEDQILLDPLGQPLLDLVVRDIHARPDAPAIRTVGVGKRHAVVAQPRVLSVDTSNTVLAATGLPGAHRFHEFPRSAISVVVLQPFGSFETHVAPRAAPADRAPIPSNVTNLTINANHLVLNGRA